MYALCLDAVRNIGNDLLEYTNASNRNINAQQAQEKMKKKRKNK